MHRSELTVRGPDVAELPGVIYDELKGERKGQVERYDGDGFDVIAVERYYLRNNSDQQATIVFDRLDEETSLVTILAGGGGAGLLQLNLRSHQAQAERIANRIADRCDSAELDLEVAD